MTEPATGQARRSAELQFSDNTKLPLLYGAHDTHLARIEHQLGVAIRSRGNTVTISGEDTAIAAAEATLRRLWDRIGDGQPVAAADIDAAVRFARRPDASSGGGDLPGIRTRRRLIQPRTPVQADYITALTSHEMVVGLGPAGTGKTYLAVAHAVSRLAAGRVDRIILSRPAVEAGERLGFLPGDMRDKVDPYLRPLYDALYDMLPGDQVTRLLETGIIEVAPLAFMRGRTLANACVILDEAQNSTAVQMKMFLTRIGENSHTAITGDLSQIDLPSGARSGLREAVEVLQTIPEVALIQFTDADVVRHPLVTRIVRAYQALDRRRGDTDAG